MGKKWGRQPTTIRPDVKSLEQRKEFLLNVCMSTIQKELGGDRINAGAAKAAVDRFAFECADIQNVTLDSSITELGLTLRLSNALEKHGFDRISVLISATTADLLACHDIGEMNVQVIREKLASNGLRLKGDPVRVGSLLKGCR